MPIVIELRTGDRKMIRSPFNATSGLPLEYLVTPEDGAFVARCLNPDVASDGDTEEYALANLQEALELYFADEV
jgi:hypothetical protein